MEQRAHILNEIVNVESTAHTLMTIANVRPLPSGLSILSALEDQPRKVVIEQTEVPPAIRALSWLWLTLCITLLHNQSLQRAHALPTTARHSVSEAHPDVNHVNGLDFVGRNKMRSAGCPNSLSGNWLWKGYSDWSVTTDGGHGAGDENPK